MKRFLPTLLTGLFLSLFLLQDTSAQTQRSRAYLHTRFETGDKPTQTDYRDVFATFFSNIEDSLNISKLVGVDTLTADPTLSGATDREIPTAAAVKSYVDSQVGGGGVTDGDKEDITVTDNGTVWNIDPDAVGAPEIATGAVGTTELANNGVTNIDLAQMPANTLKGNDTAGNATPADLTAGEAKALLNIQSGDLSDFNEAVQDQIGTTIVAGANVTVTYDDGAGTTTIASPGGGGGTDDQVASEVPVTPVGNLTSTDVQAALQEHQADIDALSAGGGVDYVTQPTPPTDTTQFWLDNSAGALGIWELKQYLRTGWQRLNYYDPIADHFSYNKPINLLNAGQSNALDRPGGGNNAVDARVFEYNGTTYIPYDLATPGENSLALQVSKHLAKRYNTTVRVHHSRQGSTNIDQWYPDSLLYNTINSIVTATGVEFDYVLWRQGEANATAGDTEVAYALKFNTVFQGFRTAGWIDTYVPIVTATLTNNYAATGVQQFFKNSTGATGDKRIRVAETAGLYSADNIHIDGASIDTAGYRMFVALTEGQDFDLWTRAANKVQPASPNDTIRTATSLAAGVLYPLARLHIGGNFGAAAQAIIEYDAANRFTIRVDAAGNLLLANSGGVSSINAVKFGGFPNSPTSTRMGGGNDAMTGGQNDISGNNAANSLVTGIRNTIRGQAAAFVFNGSTSDLSGYRVLFSETDGFGYTAHGNEALYYHTDGNVVDALGTGAGKFLADGVTPATNFNNCSYLGANTRVSANGVTGETAVGVGAIGKGDNTATIGDPNLAQLYSGNYILNTDQSLGAGQHGNALRWNNDTGEIEVSPGGAWSNTTTTITLTQDTLLNSGLVYGHFERKGDWVHFTARLNVALGSAGAGNTIYITPPIASNFTTEEADVIGLASFDTSSLSSANTAKQRALVFADTSGDKIGVSFDPVDGLAFPENRMTVTVSGSYLVQ